MKLLNTSKGTLLIVWIAVLALLIFLRYFIHTLPDSRGGSVIDSSGTMIDFFPEPHPAIAVLRLTYILVILILIVYTIVWIIRGRRKNAMDQSSQEPSNRREV